MTDDRELTEYFLDRARRDLMERYWPQLRDCISLLTEDQIWWRPNEASNSIGNLLLHVNGQLSQWIVSNFNGAELTRDRAREFTERGPIPIAELSARLASTMEESGAVLARLTPKDLATHFMFFGKSFSGLEAIFHSVSHVALHYGQIAYITKMLANRDLGFRM